MKGCVHIYCGDGKGKTSAATGLALRAAGSGMKVLFARFLKTETSSELRILDQIPEIRVIHLSKSFSFYKSSTEAQKREMTEFYRKLWEDVRNEAMSGSWQLLVLDEIMAACRLGILSAAQVADFLDHRPPELEVVMTGRNPAPELLERADYISEVRKLRHPYDRGLQARKGIEY